MVPQASSPRAPPAWTRGARTRGPAGLVTTRRRLRARAAPRPWRGGRPVRCVAGMPEVHGHTIAHAQGPRLE
eukprot:21972-Chlamydomonas_euryale.AAC.6